jgi:hypothetical protein
LRRNKDIDYLPFPICRNQVRALTQGPRHEPFMVCPFFFNANRFF